MGSFVALVRPSFRFAFQQDDELRESSFDATTAHNAVFRSYFFSIANYPMDFAPRRACSGPRHAPAPITRAVFLSHGGSARAKTQACPARRPILLASAYLVRVAGTPVELGGVP